MSTASENKPSILFIGSRFFGYEKEIINQMSQSGWNVDYFSDCPPNKLLFKILKNVSKPLTRLWCDVHFHKVFDTLAPNRYSKIFMLKGEGITRSALSYLRQRTQNIPLTLYMWDSVRNLPFGVEKLDLCDRAISFDPADALQWPHIEHEPLFFLESFQNLPAVKQDIDVLFVGTARTDRLDLLNKIRQSLPSKMVCHYKLYVQSPLQFHLGRQFNRGYREATKSDFIFAPISKSEIATLMARSRAIIDIEHFRQTGLTMRTFETLGAHRKLITTNRHIAEYDFYDSQNIHILNRDKPVLSPSFIDSPYNQSASASIRNHSFSKWVERVILK